MLVYDVDTTSSAIRRRRTVSAPPDSQIWDYNQSYGVASAAADERFDAHPESIGRGDPDSVVSQQPTQMYADVADERRYGTGLLRFHPAPSAVCSICVYLRHLRH